jgi:hypothetical protein
MANCPICEKRTDSVDEHVWTDHATSNPYCWCGKNMWDLHFNFREGVEAAFKWHCECSGGYLAHYLECQAGGG